jgi:hypothetical protein
MSTEGNARPVWVTSPNRYPTDVEKRLLNSLNSDRHTDGDSVARELAYRTLQELRIIKLILAWVLVIVPIILIVVAILVGVTSHSTPTPVQPTGF